MSYRENERYKRALFKAGVLDVERVENEFEGLYLFVKELWKRLECRKKSFMRSVCYAIGLAVVDAVALTGFVLSLGEKIWLSHLLGFTFFFFLLLDVDAIVEARKEYRRNFCVIKGRFNEAIVSLNRHCEKTEGGK
jgi:hypothetical protein